MFENFITKLQEKPVTQTKLDMGMYIYDNPLINQEALRNTLYNFNNYDDNTLINIIKESLEIILLEIFNKEKNQNYLNIITNSRFLSLFIRAVNSSNLTYDQMVRCNKLAYDYMVTEDRDLEIEKLFFSLSKVVNRNTVSILMSIGIPEDIASFMALSRYSSQKETVNVKRLNDIIIKTDNPELMTVQTIIFIYEKLFDRVSPLFEGIMTDSVSDNADYMTNNMWLIYSYISLAILEIVNNLPSEMIMSLLRAYNEIYNYYFGSITPRFNINSISDDYSRILKCLELLKLQENIIF